jgi:endonuclease/exonuclease/phosphatase family metal-dependent hydrolase
MEGIATFTRRSLAIVDRGVVPLGREVFPADGREIELLRSFQHTTIAQNGRRLCIVNVHGTVHPGSKLDTAERLAQSHTILEIVKGREGDVIICGDLNLMPDTESVRLLEAGHRNLIREYGITNTRSRLNPYFGTPQAQGFADYVFVSPGLTIRDFQVPYREISDHLPLILDVE